MDDDDGPRGASQRDLVPTSDTVSDAHQSATVLPTYKCNETRLLPGYTDCTSSSFWQESVNRTSNAGFLYNYNSTNDASYISHDISNYSDFTTGNIISDIRDVTDLTMGNMTHGDFMLGNITDSDFALGNITDDDFTLGNITFAERYVMAGAVAAISVFGAVNNLLILLVALGSPILRRKTHLLVMNLALIDFLATTTFAPLYVCSLLLDAWPFSENLCVFAAIVMSHNSGVSLLTNFAIAVNRCVLARGGSGSRLAQTPTMICGIAFIWVSVFSVNALPVIAGFVKLEYNRQYAYCAPSLNLTPLAHWVVFYSYTYAIVLTCPLLGGFIAYFMVFRSVRGSMLLTRSEFARRRYIRTSRNLTYLFGAFCACWLPDTIHFTLDPEGVKVPVYVTRLFVVLFLFNSVLNPFIFAWKFPAFRKSLRYCVVMKLLRRRVSFQQASRSTFSAGNLSPTPSPNPPMHTFTHTFNHTNTNITSALF